MRGLNRLVLFEAIGALVGLNGTGAGLIDSLVKSIISAGVGLFSAGVKSIVTLVEAIGTIVGLIGAKVGSIGARIGASYSNELFGAGVGSIGAIVIYSRLLSCVVRLRLSLVLLFYIVVHL